MRYRKGSRVPFAAGRRSREQDRLKRGSRDVCSTPRTTSTASSRESSPSPKTSELIRCQPPTTPDRWFARRYGSVFFTLIIATNILTEAGLPQRQRDALFLRYYLDFDYRAIAEALDVEVGTISATLHAARSSLMDALQEVPQ